MRAFLVLSVVGAGVLAYQRIEFTSTTDAASPGGVNEGTVALAPRDTDPKAGRHYIGEVVAKTNSALTIKPFVGKEPPRRFEVYPILASGGRSRHVTAPYLNRFAEVKVGDYVHIQAYQFDTGEERCGTICVTGRPGARVPLPQGEEDNAEAIDWNKRLNHEYDRTHGLLPPPKPLTFADLPPAPRWFKEWPAVGWAFPKSTAPDPPGVPLPVIRPNPR